MYSNIKLVFLVYSPADQTYVGTSKKKKHGVAKWRKPSRELKVFCGQKQKKKEIASQQQPCKLLCADKKAYRERPPQRTYETLKELRPLEAKKI